MAEVEDKDAASELVKEEEEETNRILKQPPKDLKSCDHDLAILVRERDADGKILKERKYAVYSQVFARHSKFVDAALSVDMKEKETREIIFHGFSPDTFELAMRYIDDPITIWNMHAEDAIEVVEFYDKYEFTTGLELCDEILSVFLKDEKHKKNKAAPINLDLMVTATAVAHRFGLIKSSEAGVEAIQKRLSIGNRNHFGPTMFTVEHIKQLQPLFVQKVLVCHHLSSTLTQQEFESPLFPRLFVSSQSNRYTARALQKIFVSGSSSEVDGEYRQQGNRFASTANAFMWNGQFSWLYIGRHESCGNDWSIWVTHDETDDEEEENEEESDGNDKILWQCPHSSNLEFPPIQPWEPTEHVPSPQSQRQPQVRCEFNPK